MNETKNNSKSLNTSFIIHFHDYEWGVQWVFFSRLMSFYGGIANYF